MCVIILPHLYLKYRCTCSCVCVCVWVWSVNMPGCICRSVSQLIYLHVSLKHFDPDSCWNTPLPSAEKLYKYCILSRYNMSLADRYLSAIAHDCGVILSLHAPAVWYNLLILLTAAKTLWPRKLGKSYMHTTDSCCSINITDHWMDQ